jgi:hypothetical protein
VDCSSVAHFHLRRFQSRNREAVHALKGLPRESEVNHNRVPTLTQTESVLSLAVDVDGPKAAHRTALLTVGLGHLLRLNIAIFVGVEEARLSVDRLTHRSSLRLA